MKKIAILDDNEQMLMLYKESLEPDFKTKTLSNKTDLYNCTEKEHIDLIIMDYNIPGEDFQNLLGYVKKNFSKAKRLLISAHTETLNLKSKYNKDFIDILSKPLENYALFKDYVKTII